MIFFVSSSISISAERDCTQYNKITHYKLWKKCSKGVETKKNGKIGPSLSNINQKYKDLRKKIAPKTAEEYWKDIRKKKNEN